LTDDDNALQYFTQADDFLKSDILNLDFEDRKTVERKNTTDLILEKLAETYLRN
jgi:hypothetical protein